MEKKGSIQADLSCGHRGLDLNKLADQIWKYMLKVKCKEVDFISEMKFQKNEYN